jgi:hypothetical protein
MKITTLTALAGLSAQAASSTHTPAAGQPAIGPHPMPSHGASALVDVTATREWTELVIAIQVARQRQRYTGGVLRAAVLAVVRSMRASGLSWELVYAALSAAVSGRLGLETVFALDCSTDVTRSAALVAHMHAWADCERLAELELAEGENAAG